MRFSIYSYLLLIIILLCPSTGQAYTVPEKYRLGVTVTHSSTMAPLSFIGVNGEPKGFVIDFWRKWSNDTGIPVTFKLAGWKEGLEKVQRGEYDIHGSLYKTPERLEFLDFAEETFPVESMLFVKKESSIHSLEDVGTRTIGALDKGSSRELILKRIPAANLKYYPSIQAEIEALVKGDVDAIVVDSHVFRYIVGRMGAGHDVEGREVVYNNHLFAGVAKGNQELLDLVNWGMEKVSMKEREDIMQRWYVADSSTSQGLRIAVILSVAGLVISTAWFFFGGRRRRGEKFSD